MVPLSPNQLYEFAFKEGLKGEKFMSCPKSYRGYIIPEMFEDGELAYGVWRSGFFEGREVFLKDMMKS